LIPDKKRHCLLLLQRDAQNLLVFSGNLGRDHNQRKEKIAKPLKTKKKKKKKLRKRNRN